MRRALPIVFLASLASCGGGAAAKSPAAAPPLEPEPTTIEEAERRIANASAEVELGGMAPAGAAAPSAPSAAQTVSSESAPSTRAKESVADEERRQGDACARPCRAIDSMRRAVTALCRMTGDDDARCTKARATLTASEARARSAACGC